MSDELLSIDRQLTAAVGRRHQARMRIEALTIAIATDERIIDGLLADRSLIAELAGEGRG